MTILGADVSLCCTSFFVINFILFSHLHHPSGDVPAEDPNHGSVLSVYAGPQAGCLPVALFADSNGWSGSCAGSVRLKVSYVSQ